MEKKQYESPEVNVRKMVTGRLMAALSQSTSDVPTENDGGDGGAKKSSIWSSFDDK